MTNDETGPSFLPFFPPNSLRFLCALGVFAPAFVFRDEQKKNLPQRRKERKGGREEFNQRMNHREHRDGVKSAEADGRREDSARFISRTARWSEGRGNANPVSVLSVVQSSF